MQPKCRNHIRYRKKEEQQIKQQHVEIPVVPKFNPNNEIGSSPIRLHCDTLGSGEVNGTEQPAKAVIWGAAYETAFKKTSLSTPPNNVT